MGKTRIKEILAQRHMTSKRLAEGVGVSQAGMSWITSDRGNPSLATLARIADYLGVGVHELFADPGVLTLRCPSCGEPLDIGIRR